MNRNKQRLSAFYSRTKRAERGDIIVKATLTEGTTGSECCVEMSSSSAIYPLTSCPCSSKYSHNPAHANKTN